MIRNSVAYIYCLWCAEKENLYVGEYVKKQAEQWLDIINGNNDEAYFDEDMFQDICDILKIMQHPDLNCSMYEGMEKYQWFIVTAVLCTRHIDGSRYYETALLEISRKNFKTFTSAIIFIIGMILEPKFSRFFSVAPDFKLSNELRIAIKKILKSSPALVDRFKINRDMIFCKLTDTEYVPLAYSNDKMDGKLANIYLADEAGAMDDYPIEAMRSSQITLRDKLGIIISTQYPNNNNVMITEIDYAKKVLDGFIENKRYFALLYEPDENIREEWSSNDFVIYQSNPVAVENKMVFKSIVDKRTMAIMYESKRENYLCKHNNIMYIGINSEGYVNSQQIKACKLENSFNWSGNNVYLGLDLAETEDNTAISMITYDEVNETVICKSWAVIPEDRVDEKQLKEKIDYKKAIAKGNCLPCGDQIISYAFVEEFISKIESEYNVNVLGCGYDIRNARATAQKLSDEHYMNMIEVKQHSSVLHPSIKWLKEMILSGKFKFEDNELLEINFTNCRQTEDTNKNKYLNKKRSVGKIDMVMSLVDALYLLEQELLGNGGFTVQTA